MNFVGELRSPRGRSRVYYAQGEDGFIKIGTSLHPLDRCAQLQARFLATEPGSFHKEHKRHHQFAFCRDHGEWFTPTPQLVTWIALLMCECEPDVEALLAPDEPAAS